MKPLIWSAATFGLAFVSAAPFNQSPAARNLLKRGGRYSKGIEQDIDIDPRIDIQDTYDVRNHDPIVVRPSELSQIVYRRPNMVAGSTPQAVKVVLLDCFLRPWVPHDPVGYKCLYLLRNQPKDEPGLRRFAIVYPGLIRKSARPPSSTDELTRSRLARIAALAKELQYFTNQEAQTFQALGIYNNSGSSPGPFGAEYFYILVRLEAQFMLYEEAKHLFVSRRGGWNGENCRAFHEYIVGSIVQAAESFAVEGSFWTAVDPAQFVYRKGEDGDLDTHVTPFGWMGQWPHHPSYNAVSTDSWSRIAYVRSVLIMNPTIPIVAPFFSRHSMLDPKKEDVKRQLYYIHDASGGCTGIKHNTKLPVRVGYRLGN